MDIRRKLKIIVLLSFFFLICCGCEQPAESPKTNQEEYPLDDSLSAIITIKEASGITQNGNNPFSLFDTKGKIIAQGTFITSEEYNNAVSLLESQNGKDGLSILKQDFQSGIGNYTYYQYDSSQDSTRADSANHFIEYDYIAMIANTNYGVMLGGIDNKQDMESVFNALDIKIQSNSDESTFVEQNGKD